MTYQAVESVTCEICSKTHPMDSFDSLPPNWKVINFDCDGLGGYCLLCDNCDFHAASVKTSHGEKRKVFFVIKGGKRDN